LTEKGRHHGLHNGEAHAVRGGRYPRNGACSTGIIQESDGPLVGLGSRFVLNLSIIATAAIVVVVVFHPVHSEKVESLPDVLDYLRKRFLKPSVVCGCFLAVVYDISISIRASLDKKEEHLCHAIKRLCASKLPRIMHVLKQARSNNMIVRVTPI
jgi:hypothetical protein